MNAAITRVLCASVLFLAVASGWGAGHSHQGTRPDQGQKKDQAPDPGPGSGSFDVTAVNQEVLNTSNGASRRVLANDSSDAKQIGLIRSVLKALADGFEPGVFWSPANTQHPPTSALSALRSAPPGQVRVQYLEVRAGAEIRYSAADPTLVSGLREWLHAQLPDEAATPSSARGDAFPAR